MLALIHVDAEVNARSMQIIGMISILDFYRTLRAEFPSIDRLSIWNDSNRRTVKRFHTSVISALSTHIILWTEIGDYANTKKLLEEVEHALVFGDESLYILLRTDFIKIILEHNNENVRERIKEMMGEMTAEAYRKNEKNYLDRS